MLLNTNTRHYTKYKNLQSDRNGPGEAIDRTGARETPRLAWKIAFRHRRLQNAWGSREKPFQLCSRVQNRTKSRKTRGITRNLTAQDRESLWTEPSKTNKSFDQLRRDFKLPESRRRTQQILSAAAHLTYKKVRRDLTITLPIFPPGSSRLGRMLSGRYQNGVEVKKI